MELAVHSDASYLSKPKARSRAGGHSFLSNEAVKPKNNGAILNITHIIEHIITSATEDEIAALYTMARKAIYIRSILEEMGHKQPPTPLQIDNAMSDAVCNGKIQPKQKNQWTCDSIGSGTENANNNSESIGDQTNKIMQTTGQSTIQQPTTKTQ